jgi:integrase
MARQRWNRLSARSVLAATKPGMYADGAGLYLRVARSGARSWCLRYMLEGKAHEMGLGGLSKLGLADARRKAAEQRLFLVDKIDPIEKRKTERAAKRAETARAVTFDECARAYVDAHRPAWRHAKHYQQWISSLAQYVSPVIGALPVRDIDTALVMRIIEPLWSSRPETASRIRGRIESVLDWARVRGYREGENPARWRGHLDHLLPARSKVRKVRHYRALPYTDIGAFISELRSRAGVGAAALEFLILCAARSSEVADARWAEIDRAARVWIVPAERMKSGREHRVPLSGAAMSVLDRLKNDDGEFVFSNAHGRGLGKGALAKQLKGWNCTVHGFRSAFRDWAAERTSFPREVAEAALAHAIEDRTEAAYRRTDLLEKRRRLMDAWAAYCAQPPAEHHKVLPLQRAMMEANRGG